MLFLCCKGAKGPNAHRIEREYLKEISKARSKDRGSRKLLRRSNMKKSGTRITSLLVVLTMIISMFPAQALACTDAEAAQPAVKSEATVEATEAEVLPAAEEAEAPAKSESAEENKNAEEAKKAEAKEAAAKEWMSLNPVALSLPPRPRCRLFQLP